MDLRLHNVAFWASLEQRPYEQTLQVPETVQSSFALTAEQLMCSPEKSLLTPSVEAGVPDEQPHLWMWVNPNLVCPIPGRASAAVPLTESSSSVGDPESSSSSLAPMLSLPREAKKVIQKKKKKKNSTSGPDTPLLQKRKGDRGTSPAAWKSKRKLKRAQGGWPRPPLNYCLLISLALSSSVDRSLTVQEIYQFTRQHFPFFRTAPEGWKNTIRHNLCFSNSFEKTTDFVCLEGNRKSRLWKLTIEGHRKFQEEVQALPEDRVGLVHQSMDKPELMRSLFVWL